MSDVEENAGQGTPSEGAQPEETSRAQELYNLMYQAADAWSVSAYDGVSLARQSILDGGFTDNDFVEAFKIAADKVREVTAKIADLKKQYEPLRKAARDDIGSPSQEAVGVNSKLKGAELYKRKLSNIGIAVEKSTIETIIKPGLAEDEKKLLGLAQQTDPGTP